MRGNGLVVWLLAGVGVVLMYAAIKGATIASVLAGHPVKAAGTSSTAAVPSVTPKSLAAPFSPSNPFGTIVPKGPNPFPAITPLGQPLP